MDNWVGGKSTDCENWGNGFIDLLLVPLTNSCFQNIRQSHLIVIRVSLRNSLSVSMGNIKESGVGAVEKCEKGNLKICSSRGPQESPRHALQYANNL